MAVIPTPSFVASSPRWAELTDEQAVERVLAGDVELFELLMRRHNRRVFRAIRGIVKDEMEAEDTAQETWLAAYRALAGFEGRAAFGTWLTRIAIRRALARVQQRRPAATLDELDQASAGVDESGPEAHARRKEMARVLEAAIDSLPPSYRVVILLRDLEHMSTTEAAHALDVSEHNLRVRLHRARAALRERVVEEIGDAALEVFGFAGARCDRLVKAVFAQLRPVSPAS